MNGDGQDSWRVTPIAVVHSPFRERFGIPRQPGLVPAAKGVIELHPPFNAAEAVRGLDGFSHIWVLVLLDRLKRAGWRPTVRPPRLGGNRRLGVFASRSPFRPNPLGISVLPLDRIDCTGGGVRLHVSALDLLDGTPVLDIKPYVPYADSVPTARSGFAAEAPPAVLPVRFSETATEQLAAAPTEDHQALSDLIVQVIKADPRPPYRDGVESGRTYTVTLDCVHVRWAVEEGEAVVLAVSTAKQERT